MSKFKRWDQKTIFNTLQKVIQIKAKIEEHAEENQAGPASMPSSVIPTDVLYDITSCFAAMYDKLLDRELLEAGYPKTDKNIYQ